MGPLKSAEERVTQGCIPNVSDLSCVISSDSSRGAKAAAPIAEHGSASNIGQKGHGGAAGMCSDEESGSVKDSEKGRVLGDGSDRNTLRSVTTPE